ncbi:TPA: D-aminoacyl-tRNA deacylase [Streptococcus suis]
MRIVIQKIKSGAVRVQGQVTGQIEQGFLLYIGISPDDDEADLAYCVRKVSQMRLFEDQEGKMNLSLMDVGGAILSVSQFTLYADTKKGNRPSFASAAKPDYAQALYDRFNHLLRDLGIRVETGVFGAMMEVDAINDGPVTIWLDSKAR